MGKKSIKALKILSKMALISAKLLLIVALSTFLAFYSAWFVSSFFDSDPEAIVSAAGFVLLFATQIFFIPYEVMFSALIFKNRL